LLKFTTTFSFPGKVKPFQVNSFVKYMHSQTNERGPKIKVACAARDLYFRYLFANCVRPKVFSDIILTRTSA
jgi:hypothetical protein